MNVAVRTPRLDAGMQQSSALCLPNPYLSSIWSSTNVLVHAWTEDDDLTLHGSVAQLQAPSSSPSGEELQ